MIALRILLPLPSLTGGRTCKSRQREKPHGEDPMRPISFCFSLTISYHKLRHCFLLHRVAKCASDSTSAGFHIAGRHPLCDTGTQCAHYYARSRSQVSIPMLLKTILNIRGISCVVCVHNQTESSIDSMYSTNCSSYSLAAATF